MPSANHRYCIAVDYKTYLTSKEFTGRIRNPNLQNASMPEEGNIFQKQILHPIQITEIPSHQPYHFVGYPLLKNYSNKSKKNKRLTKKEKQQLLTQSRASTGMENLKNNYFTKQQIKEDMLNRLSFNKQGVKQFEASFNLRNSMNETMASNSTNLYRNSSLSKENIFEKMISIQKIKKKLKTWNQENSVLFPSIFKSIDSHRLKIEKRSTNELISQKEHMQSRQWQEILRSQSTLSNFYENNLTKIYKDGEKMFCIKGKEKLSKEMKWLDETDNKSHGFLLIDDGLMKNTKIM